MNTWIFYGLDILLYVYQDQDQHIARHQILHNTEIYSYKMVSPHILIKAKIQFDVRIFFLLCLIVFSSISDSDLININCIILKQFLTYTNFLCRTVNIYCNIFKIWLFILHDHTWFNASYRLSYRFSRLSKTTVLPVSIQTLMLLIFLQICVRAIKIKNEIFVIFQTLLYIL